MTAFAREAQAAALQGGGAQPGTSGTSGARRIDFRLRTVGAGLGATLLTGNSHTGGVAWLDYNGDLLPDLFVSNGGGRDHYLFRNDGDGTFTDVSSLVTKPDLALEDAGAYFADVDNDGDDDLLVPVDNPAQVVVSQPVNPPDGGPNLFYRNQGDGTFIEEAALLGLVHPLGRRTITAGFADFDRDGFVDLYLGSWTIYGLPLGVHDDYDRLLRNDGTGSFLDVTSIYGTDGYGLDALVCLWFDVNGDHWPDLYVGNTAHTVAPPIFDPTDVFYVNQGGAGFVDQVPLQPGLGNDAQAAMGMDVADIDNDGDWDFYCTDNLATGPSPFGNVLYLGDGAGGLTDNVSDLAGVQADDSWPCAFGDLNQDGWVDLWVGTTARPVPDFVYRNRGDGTFESIAGAGVDQNACKGGALADYDGDGDLDIAIFGQGQSVRLFRNESVSAGSWLEVKLYGTDSNRSAIGAVVKATTNGRTQMRRVSGGNSAHSQNEAILHFGLGPAAAADLVVEWPSGAMQSFPAVAAGALVRIDETDGILSEGITDGGSRFDPESGTLDVRLRSTQGGRTRLALEGLGSLRYDAASGTHCGRFTQRGTAPRSLSVRSAAGGRWSLPLLRR